jgi:ribonuclease T2
MLNRTLSTVAAAGLAILAGCSGSALAQSDGDSDRFEKSGEHGRNVPGDFDYYALVLSWSPTHCAAPEGDDELQCRRNDGRRYGFVLHGLWPQYERGYPESCPTPRRPYVPNTVIDGMLDIMPNRGLVIHEYRAHGTCSGLDPASFFETARRLYGKIKIPERYVNPFEAQFVNPDDLIEQIIDENAGLTSDMVAVTCASPGNRLRDVRICFSKSGEYRRCGDNETQSRLCKAANIFMPPVRSTKVAPEGSEERERSQASPLPMPRAIPRPVP